MMKIKTRYMMWIPLLSLMAPSAIRAADTAGTTPTTHPAPHKRAPRHKTPPPDSVALSSAVAPVGTAGTNVGNATKSAQDPNFFSSQKGNDAGRPNMGSPDHVPGTTGTSGR